MENIFSMFFLYEVSSINILRLPWQLFRYPAKSKVGLITERSKTVLLLWILFAIYISVCHTVLSVHCSLVVNCWGNVCDVFLCFVTFPCGVLGKVWYLIVSIPDLCLLSYYVQNENCTWSSKVYICIFTT